MRGLKVVGVVLPAIDQPLLPALPIVVQPCHVPLVGLVQEQAQEESGTTHPLVYDQVVAMITPILEVLTLEQGKLRGTSSDPTPAVVVMDDRTSVEPLAMDDLT